MWHFLPNGPALNEGVQRFLKSVKRGEFSSSEVFDCRIGANLLAISGREQEAIIAADPSLNKHLSVFLDKAGETDALMTILSTRIKENYYALDDKGLIKILTSLAEERLKVDNPRYPALSEMNK